MTQPEPTVTKATSPGTVAFAVRNPDGTVNVHIIRPVRVSVLGLAVRESETTVKETS